MPEPKKKLTKESISATEKTELKGRADATIAFCSSGIPEPGGAPRMANPVAVLTMYQTPYARYIAGFSRDGGVFCDVEEL